MALPLYAITLFVSAFILFLVQPIIGKILLPKLGGTPQVWNTCMVFFQMVLLAGYAYTHNVSTKLNLRQQLIAHAVLLFLPLIMLLPIPFALSFLGPENSIRAFVPDLGSNPIPSTLKILFLYVALPFVVVATTAPLLQKWFGFTGHPAAKDPYFLYGASNFGSMLSLILYPFAIEPYFSLGNQTYLYLWGFLALIVLVLSCAALVWNAKDTHQPRTVVKPEAVSAVPPSPTTGDAQTGIAAGAPAASPTPAPAASTAMKQGQPPKQLPGKPGTRLPGVHHESSVALPSDDVTAARRFRWVMLAAVPSSLMLGITTHITTDLSPIPFFWLLPLIAYLGSFILVFMRWPFLWTERLHEPGTDQGGIKPHTYMVYAQPFLLFFMIMVDVWNLTSSPAMISVAIVAHGLGFFATTMVCHGELARDRPTTKHLTEFYLWMSVGGMVGGMFNALIAPVLFPKLWELPLAIFAAALVRPKMFDTGLFDNYLATILESPTDAQPAPKGHKGPRPQHAQVASESLVGKLDWAWPIAIFILSAILMLLFSDQIAFARTERSIVTYTLIAFGIPLILACISMARPLRIGLGVGAVLLMYNFHQSRNDRSVHASRSYFGTISVKESAFKKRVEGKEVDFIYRQLVHGHINHGLNYLVPEPGKGRGDPERDLSRLATTYYHREGPVGRVMEKFNWFSNCPPNTYPADARIGASLVGSFAADAVSSSLPIVDLVSLWSEPPIATIGLGTGTMASYGRPYQHVHFYEIDNQIRRLSLVMPTSQIKTYREYKKIKDETPMPTYFNYLERAMERGSTVQVLMGDARLRMALQYKNHYLDESDRGGGPNNFYHMMVVDAFSSDAIPAHLLTEEAFKKYFEKLVPEGVLCVHTSNRFVDLPKVVGAVAAQLEWEEIGEDGKKRVRNYVAKRGHDINDSHEAGHYTSEWVMVARKSEYILRPEGDADFLDRYQAALRAKDRRDPYWDIPKSDKKYVWTDDYYNLMSVVRFR